MWHGLFAFINIWATLAWVLLLFFPRKPLTNSAIMYLGVGLLCFTYLVLFTMVMGGLVDPNRAVGVGEGSFTSIEGIRAFFGSDGGVVVGWTHYLAFDLFTGMWISRDADAKGFSRLVQLPFLVLTFMVGPIGLFFWLIVRERRARASARG